MTASVDRKLTKAKANLVMTHPFFGALALRMRLVPDETIPTACCDGAEVRYNPQFIASLPQNKVMGLLAHEVMHPAFLHHTRRGSRDAQQWNIACDFAINSLLVDAGFELPKGGCVDAKYRGMSAEQIYASLPQQPSNLAQDPGGDGAVSDNPGGADAQAADEADWKTAVTQAAHVAKLQGKLPGAVERMIEKLLEPVLPWRSILRRFMTERPPLDTTWSKVNRRFVSQGLYLPSRDGLSHSGEIAVVIDTSGSIRQEELNAFGAEVAGIVAELRPSTTYVMYCDTRVAHVDTFEPDDELTFTVRGGGGTDFRPPFKWLEDRGITPEVLVYFTDGHGAFPSEEAAYPTLWVMHKSTVTPPHGEHLCIS